MAKQTKGWFGVRWLAVAVTVVACGPPAMAPSPQLELSPTAAPSASAAPVAEMADQVVGEMLLKVAAARELPILHPVRGRLLSRSEVTKRIKAKVERDVPPEVLLAQGEFLRALGLIPLDYDFVQGIYGLLEEQLAGFYDPEEKVMVLLDDLSQAGTEETLAHELVHALQDQHYDLEPKIKYRPHDSDRAAAVQTLAEGDATVAMFEVSGDADAISEGVLRFALVASMALTDRRLTPRVLQSSLLAPYLDGFRVVKQLRQVGGWRSVDAVWSRIPTTTEQLLHPDKYQAHEPGIEISVPAITPLGSGWKVLDHDLMGEQGLRIILEQWSARSVAWDAAAGWGGDRFLVAFRPDGASGGEFGEGQYAVAWLIRFDTNRDAQEAAELLEGALGAACSERADLGALTWRSHDSAVVLMAGPYHRDRQGTCRASSPSCPLMEQWAQQIVTSQPLPSR